MTEDNGRIKIYAGDGYTTFKAADKVFSKLMSTNHPPTIFVRANKLIQIVPDADTGHPIIREMSEDVLSGVLNKIAMFYKVRKGEDGKNLAIEKPVPRDVVKYVLFNTDKSPAPVLDGVSCCPIITFDGKIQTGGGYNENLRIIYIPTISPSEINVTPYPDKNDVKEAFDFIENMIIDFKFVSDADRANYIGLLFSTVLKPAMKNYPYPMPIISKPIQGAGASKLSKTIGYLLNGEEPGMFALQDDEELEKKLLGSAMQGENIIIYDNITGPLYSSVLAKQITATRFKGRILGKTGNVEYFFSPIWCANGLNVVANDDMPRRCYPINLDPGVEKPWTLTGFTHTDYDEYVLTNRGKILSALFTIIRYWAQQKEKPAPHKDVPQMGSFEDWRNVIGGIMSLSEKYGPVFLTNVKTIYENCDLAGDQWREFLGEWYTKWKFNQIRISELVQEIEGISEIKYSLPGSIVNARTKGKDLPSTLGRELNKIANRVYRISILARNPKEPTELFEEILVKIKPEEIRNKKHYALCEVIAK